MAYSSWIYMSISAIGNYDNDHNYNDDVLIPQTRGDHRKRWGGEWGRREVVGPSPDEQIRKDHCDWSRRNWLLYPADPSQVPPFPFSPNSPFPDTAEKKKAGRSGEKQEIWVATWQPTEWSWAPTSIWREDTLRTMPASSPRLPWPTSTMERGKFSADTRSLTSTHCESCRRSFSQSLLSPICMGRRSMVIGLFASIMSDVLWFDWKQI